MKSKISKLLASIHPDLRQLRDDYFIIGSCAMLLSGIAVPIITDLDLLMSSGDAETLKGIWSHKMRKDFSPENHQLFRSNFARFNFGEFDIEVMGNLEVCKKGQWLPVLVNQATEVSINEMRIKIPTMAEQKRIFLLFGRKKDVAKAEQIEMCQNDK